MRIAFITQEFPPDIAKGGIATYVNQVSRILYERGNDVEVFCGSYTRNITENLEGIIVHRCQINDTPNDFQQKCFTAFVTQHTHKPFDVIESPEIHASALLIKQMFPLLPLVVKLHMASFIQTRLLNYYTGRLARLRYFLGGLRRGKINIFGQYNFLTDSEYHFTQMAEGLVSPSDAQKKIITDEWGISDESITVMPNPYIPPNELLKIPVKLPVKKNITFIGKLNVHKGIVNLIKVIPHVIRKHPDALFILIGSDSFFPVKKMYMSEYIKQELKNYENNYVIKGALEYEDVLKVFQTTAICIFPSLWECFGLVCLESMSAGRAVIGSKEGGMKDILSDDSGILIDPHNIKEMADSINLLLENENLRWQYGDNGRNKVISKYNKEIIGEQMENYFEQIISETKIKHLKVG